jgi:hypothetical protein
MLRGPLLALALALAALTGCGGDDDAGTVPDSAVGGSCTGINAPGNSKKVGEYCTRRGGQCADNGAGNATICAIDFDPDTTSTATFCTKSCVDELSCGPDSVCIGDSPASQTKGCVPVVCAPDWATGDGGLRDAQ